VNQKLIPGLFLFLRRLNPSIVRGQIVLHLSLIVLIEEEQGGKLMGSDKILLHLAPPKQGTVKL
jgi:hypothetical protein